MGLTPRQKQVLENKVATVELEGQNVHKAVDDYLLKVKSWKNALIESQESEEKCFLQIRLDLEKAIDYFEEISEEIERNFTDMMDFTLENTEAIKLLSIACAEVAAFTPSTSPSESSELQSDYQTDYIIDLGTEMKNLKDDIKKIVNGMEQIAEDQMAKLDNLEKLVIEKTEMFKSIEILEERVQEGERTLLDFSTLVERQMKSDRIIKAQMFETYQLMLEKIRQSEKKKTESIEAEKTQFQKNEADIVQVKEKPRKSEVDETVAIKKLLMLLEDKTEINNQDSEQKQITDNVRSVELPEGEVCCDVCKGLKKRDCTKNPGHKDFIDITDLKLEHLPDCYSDKLVIDCIKAVSDLVVRVIAQYVSPARPDGFFLADKRGQHINNFGSGWVWCLERKSKEKKNDHCPCGICRTSATSHRHWATFRMITTRNVVYDSREATSIICELFYDSEEARGKGLILEGVEVFDRNMDDDCCMLKCVSHDQELIKKMEEMLERRDTLVRELNIKYWGLKPDDNVVVVVSHPHGCKKQISLGKVTYRETFAPHKIYYSAPTCAGSSGGLVWLLGQGNHISSMSYVNTHSGGSLEGNNNFSATVQMCL